MDWLTKKQVKEAATSPESAILDCIAEVEEQKNEN